MSPFHGVLSMGLSTVLHPVHRDVTLRGDSATNIVALGLPHVILPRLSHRISMDSANLWRMRLIVALRHSDCRMNGDDFGSIRGGSNVFTLFFQPWEDAVPLYYLVFNFIFGIQLQFLNIIHVSYFFFLELSFSSE